MAYEATPTYWLEPTDQVSRALRRFTFSTGHGHGCAAGNHEAFVHIGTSPAVYRDDEHGRLLNAPPSTPRDDPRWPIACTSCGYTFTADDQWQDWQELIYRRADIGEQVTLRQRQYSGAPAAAPPGAMWNAWWMPESWRGQDGIALMVRLPNGHDWHVDGEASNCTRKGDKTHACWVRHGDPRTGQVHVDKNGSTCAAGAGSILAGDYHGFLHQGVLTAG